MLESKLKANTILPHPLSEVSQMQVSYWTHLPIAQGLGPVQGSITQKSLHTVTPHPSMLLLSRQESVA